MESCELFGRLKVVSVEYITEGQNILRKIKIRNSSFWEELQGIHNQLNWRIFSNYVSGSNVLTFPQHIMKFIKFDLVISFQGPRARAPTSTSWNATFSPIASTGGPCENSWAASSSAKTTRTKSTVVKRPPFYPRTKKWPCPSLRPWSRWICPRRTFLRFCAIWRMTKTNGGSSCKIPSIRIVGSVAMVVRVNWR